ncbi:MAG: TolC family protein [Bacteroidales bacterium]
MKKIVISLILITADLFIINAQERDLNFYIRQAKENSPLINQAENENKIVSLDLQQMNRILYKPEINVISGFTFSPIISRDNNNSSFHLVSEGATDYIGHDLALTDGGQYQALVSMRQSLLSGSKYKTYVNKADISQQINENNITLTIHELEQVVGYQYLLCIRSLKEAENSLSLIRNLEEQYALIQKLVENGVYKQTDLMLMQIELENYNLEYKGYQADYISNLYDLNLISGISDTIVVGLQDIEFKINPVTAAKSGFLTGFKLDSLNILSDQAVNELKYKPQLDLFADAGLNAAYLPYPRRLGLSAGLALTWNIFDGHQKNIQREKSTVNLQTLEFRKNNFMTQNEISRNKILNQLNSVKERIMLNEMQADKYKHLAEAYSKELSLGEASIMDFKNLLKDIAAKNQELLQLRMEKQFLINSYNYLNF